MEASVKSSPADPVLEWIAGHNYNFRLQHEACFELDLGSLIVRSNAAKVIETAQDAFCYYPLGRQSCNEKRETVIEVSYVGSQEKIDILNSDSAWGYLFSNQMTTDRLAENLEKGFVHVNHDGVRSFWKPNEILISFSDRNTGPIRVLVSDFYKSGALPTLKRRYRSKGLPVIPDNVGDIIDLIKILYIRYNKLFCIHAASVAFGHNGIIITGSSGMGKSTTALSLMRAGATLLSDELTLIDIHHPKVMRIRGLLVPPYIVGREPVELEQLEKTLDSKFNNRKCAIPLASSFVESSRDCCPRALAVFFLERLEPSHTSHKITPMSKQEAFIGLMTQALDLANSYQRDARTQAFIALAESCSTYRLSLGRRLHTLPNLIISTLGTLTHTK